MIFKLFLKLVKAESEEDWLKWSVYYGWGLVMIGFISFCLVSVISESTTSSTSEFFALTFGIAGLLFAFRYTSTKPFLGAIAGGVTVISIGFIIDSLFSRRGNGVAMGAFVGVMLTLLFILIKNIVVGLYYLTKETIRYVQYKKSTQRFELEETDLKMVSEG